MPSYQLALSGLQIMRAVASEVPAVEHLVRPIAGNVNRAIDWSDQGLTGPTLQWLFEHTRALKNVFAADLSHNPLLSNSTMLAIHEAAQTRGFNPRSLNLSLTGLKDRWALEHGAGYFPATHNFSKLEEIDLDSNRGFTGRGFVTFANSPIRRASLISTGIDDVGLGTIADSIGGSVEKLTMNAVRRSGLRDWSALTRMSKINDLSVVGADFDDAAAKVAAKLPELKVVDARYTATTGDGVRALGQNPTLETLRVNDRVREADVAAFHEQRAVDGLKPVHVIHG